MAKRKKGLSFYKREKKVNKTKIKEALSLFFWMFAVSFIAFVFVFLFGTRLKVIGVSMEPTLHNSQTVLVDKAVYMVFSPHRNDLVMFLPNGNTNSHYYVKRVVGLPGETVQIINGQVYINGELLENQGKYGKIENPGLAEHPFVLGDKEYFVLGDNRNNSEDSRSGNIGGVKKEDITGKVWFHFAAMDDGIGFVR